MIRSIRQSIAGRGLSRSNAAQPARLEAATPLRTAAVAAAPWKTDHLELSLSDFRPPNLINIRVDATSHGLETLERADDLHNIAGTLIQAPPSPRTPVAPPNTPVGRTRRAASHNALSQLSPPIGTAFIKALDLHVSPQALASATSSATKCADDWRILRKFVSFAENYSDEKVRADAFLEVAVKPIGMSDLNTSALHTKLRRKSAEIHDTRARLHALGGLAEILPKYDAAHAHNELRILTRGLKNSMLAGARFGVLARNLPAGDEAAAHSALRKDIGSIRCDVNKLAAIASLAEHLPPGRASAPALADLKAHARTLQDPLAQERAKTLFPKLANNAA